MENNSEPAKSQSVNTGPAKSQPCNAARIQKLASQYKGRWGFLRYLTGLGFSIYNEYKNKFSVDVYQKLFISATTSEKPYETDPYSIRYDMQLRQEYIIYGEIRQGYRYGYY